MKHIRAFITNLVLLTLALCLFSGGKAVARAASSIAYRLWIGGTQVTYDNRNHITWPNGSGYATYDSDKHILTFYDAIITTTTTEEISGESTKAGVYANFTTDLTIKGDVTFELPNDSCGIYYKTLDHMYAGRTVTIDGNITMKESGGGIWIDDSNLHFKSGKTSIKSANMAVATRGGKITFEDSEMIVTEPEVYQILTKVDLKCIATYSGSPANKVTIEKKYGNKGTYTIQLTSPSVVLRGREALTAFYTANYVKTSMLVGTASDLHNLVFDLNSDGIGDIKADVTLDTYDVSRSIMVINVLDECTYSGDFIIDEKDLKLDFLNGSKLPYYAPMIIKIPQLNNGECTLDMTGGEADISAFYCANPYDPFYNTLYWVEQIDHALTTTYSEPRFYELDVDNNGTPDIILKDFDGKCILHESNSVHGDKVIVLSNAAKQKCIKERNPYFSKLTIKFPKADTPGSESDDTDKPSTSAVTTSNTDTQVEINAEEPGKLDKTQKGTSFTKLKAGKKSITLSWKKQNAKGIKGYEIQYSMDKSFKKNVKTVTINKTKTTSKTIKKLTSKKKYYVRIRTFRKKGAEKLYSKWSKTKNVKVK